MPPVSSPSAKASSGSKGSYKDDAFRDYAIPAVAPASSHRDGSGSGSGGGGGGGGSMSSGSHQRSSTGSSRNGPALDSLSGGSSDAATPITPSKEESREMTFGDSHSRISPCGTYITTSPPSPKTLREGLPDDMYLKEHPATR